MLIRHLVVNGTGEKEDLYPADTGPGAKGSFGCVVGMQQALLDRQSTETACLPGTQAVHSLFKTAPSRALRSEAALPAVPIRVLFYFSERCVSYLRPRWRAQDRRRLVAFLAETGGTILAPLESDSKPLFSGEHGRCRIKESETSRHPRTGPVTTRFPFRSLRNHGECTADG